MNPKIIQAIAVTAELTGTELSEPAIRLMESDLSGYPADAVLRALDRCRKELKCRMTLAAVIERIDDRDGRPGAEEAWALALGACDESATVVWNDEIAQAYATAAPLLDARDKVGARMAFKEAYERITRQNRDLGFAPRWYPSLGSDLAQRESALTQAAERGLLPPAVAQALIPHGVSVVATALIGGQTHALLSGPDITAEQREINRRGLDALKAHLKRMSNR